MEGQSSACWNSVVGDTGPQGFMASCHGEAPPMNSCDENISYVVGEHIDGNNGNGKEKNESPWHRVKWTDLMVKLLINVVSYIGEDATSDCSGGRRRISPTLPKKGKWKAISRVMQERGFHVSPQQCEDKFNDLNKRYKKLNDILGRGTSCDVVENPALLDSMDIPEKAKESVRRILSSKQLFFREMCSYHSGNRLYIPHDPSVQRSLQLALRSSHDLEFHEAKPYRFDGIDHDEENDGCDSENDVTQETLALYKDIGSKSVLAKRKKPDENEYLDSGYILKFHSATKGHAPHDHATMNEVSGQSVDVEWQIHKIMCRRLQLEEQELGIEAAMLELEKERLRWLQVSELEKKELEKMRLENEYLMLENERLALDIKCRELGLNGN